MPTQTNRFQNIVDYVKNSAQAFLCCLFITFLLLFAEKSLKNMTYMYSTLRNQKANKLHGFQSVRGSVLLCFTGSRDEGVGKRKPRIAGFVSLLSIFKCLNFATLAFSDEDSYSHWLLRITKLGFLDLHRFLTVWKVAEQIWHEYLYDVTLNYIRLNLWQSLSVRGGTPAVRSWIYHCSKGNAMVASLPPILINKKITRSPLKENYFYSNTASLSSCIHPLTVVGLFALVKLYTTLKDQVQHLVDQDFPIYTMNSLFVLICQKLV